MTNGGGTAKQGRGLGNVRVNKLLAFWIRKAQGRCTEMVAFEYLPVESQGG